MLTSPIFRKRLTQYSGLLEVDDWRFKVYHITALGNNGIPKKYDSPVRTTIRDALRYVDPEVDNYRVGFCVVHEGTRGLFLCVDWWTDKKELNHLGYYSEYGSKVRLKRLGPKDSIGCVWDLRVMAWETDAWLASTRLEPNRARELSYLRRHL